MMIMKRMRRRRKRVEGRQVWDLLCSWLTLPLPAENTFENCFIMFGEYKLWYNKPVIKVGCFFGLKPTMNRERDTVDN